MSAATGLALGTYDTDDAKQQVPTIRDIFAAVFAEPPYHEGPDDVREWLDDLAGQLTRPGFSMVLARMDEMPVGFAYGYTITPGAPRWQHIVEPLAGTLPREALRQRKVFTLMEFAVLARWRRQGIGRALHDRLLLGRDEPLAILTVRADADDAQAAYRSWGWQKVWHRPRKGEAGYDVMLRRMGQAGQNRSTP